LHVDKKILTTTFACDLEACKAACCTFPGGSGPPVLDNEIALIDKAWALVKSRVPLPHRQLVESDGLFVVDEGELTIRCYDERACVFVLYENGIARCSIQKAHDHGEFSWPKPISCHLFPIRVRGKQRDQLRFERFSECDPALDLGKQLDLPLVDFLRDALQRAFGDEAFKALKDRSDALRDGGG